MINKQQCIKNKLLKFFQLIKYGVIDEVLKKEYETLHDDWRLPTIVELKTLVNYERRSPACDLEDTRPGWYWSSSPYISDSRYAWVVHFYYGRDVWNYKSYSRLVRCVRSGKNGLEWSASSDIKMDWDKAIEYAENLVAPVYYKDNR